MRTHGIGRVVRKRVVGLLMAGATGLTLIVAATIAAFPVLAQQQYAATRPPGAQGSMPGTYAGTRPPGSEGSMPPTSAGTRVPGQGTMVSPGQCLNNARCFKGVDVPIRSYGSSALISAVQPDIGNTTTKDRVSFMFVETAVSVSAGPFVQTGWGRTYACNNYSQTYAFAEY